MKISQQTYAEQLAERYVVESGEGVQLPIGIEPEKSYDDEISWTWPLRTLTGALVWVFRQTRPDISNAVRAVA